GHVPRSRLRDEIGAAVGRARRAETARAGERDVDAADRAAGIVDDGHPQSRRRERNAEVYCFASAGVCVRWRREVRVVRRKLRRDLMARGVDVAEPISAVAVAARRARVIETHLDAREWNARVAVVVAVDAAADRTRSER